MSWESVNIETCLCMPPSVKEDIRVQTIHQVCLNQRKHTLLIVALTLHSPVLPHVIQQPTEDSLLIVCTNRVPNVSHSDRHKRTSGA